MRGKWLVVPSVWGIENPVATLQLSSSVLLHFQKILFVTVSLYAEETSCGPSVGTATLSQSCWFPVAHSTTAGVGLSSPSVWSGPAKCGHEVGPARGEGLATGTESSLSCREQVWWSKGLPGSPMLATPLVRVTSVVAPSGEVACRWDLL